MQNIRLNNGVQMPIVGLGTFPMKGEELKSAISNAISVGYRSIDTAWLYGNENDIGDAIMDAGIPRSHLWLTSKIHVNDVYLSYHPRFGIQLPKKTVRKAYEESLRRLRTDYLDLYLIHSPWQPACFRFWKELERLYSDGRIRSIGVSNFGISELQQLIDSSHVIPAINQVEINPFNKNKKLIAFCQSHNIQVEAYSPFGRGLLTKELFSDPIIVELAARKKRTSAQIILRWLIQQDIVVIPRSRNIDNQRDNLDIFDFNLSPEEMGLIDGLNKNVQTTGGILRTVQQ